MQVDAQMLINLLSGTLFAVGGWFARHIMSELNNLRASVHAVEVDLPSNYVKKEEYREDMREIKEILHRISDRLAIKGDTMKKFDNG